MDVASKNMLGPTCYSVLLRHGNGFLIRLMPAAYMGYVRPAFLYRSELMCLKENEMGGFQRDPL